MNVAMNRQRWLLALWLCGMTSIMTLPWSDLQGHAHWSRVSWVPFVAPVDNVRDVVLNVAVFVPFGFLLSDEQSVNRRLGMLGILAAASLLSGIGEFCQVYSPSRFPSATDVVSNTLGAAGGAALYMLRRGAGR